VIDISSRSCKTKFKSAGSAASSAVWTIRASLWAGKAGRRTRVLPEAKRTRNTVALRCFSASGKLGWRPATSGEARRTGARSMPMPMPRQRQEQWPFRSAPQLNFAQQGRNQRPKFSVSSFQASQALGRRSSWVGCHQVLPNPSFKGEAQRHVTLTIKRRGLRPILRLLSSAPCRRAPP
jgi:hypothetical protein